LRRVRLAEQTAATGIHPEGTPMTNDSLTIGLLLASLLIATVLYGQLIRRRHRAGNALQRSIDAIADNYGRSGLP
jgi:hypothetical protein